MAFVIVDTETGRPLRRTNGEYIRTSGGLEHPKLYKSEGAARHAMIRAKKLKKIKGVFRVEMYNVQK